MTDARVEQTIEQIDRKIDKYEAGPEEQERALDQRNVALRNGSDQHLSKPWPGEDLLCHHCTAEHVAEPEPYHGHYWQHGVSKSVPAYHHRLAHALRSGRADIVQSHYLHKGGACHARDEGQRKCSE